MSKKLLGQLLHSSISDVLRATALIGDTGTGWLDCLTSLEFRANSLQSALA